MEDAGSIIDIAATFRSLFGYVPEQMAHVPEVQDGQIPANDFKVNPQYKYAPKTVTVKGSPLYGLADTIGREVFCPLTIKAGADTYEFPFVVLGMKSKKILVETPMVERGGSVIEEIGFGPWEIAVKGFLIDPLNQFPDDQLDKLIQLYKYQQPVSVVCALSDLALEIDDKCVIRDLDIPAKAKVIGVRDFSFNLVQDAILDLYKVD